MLIRKEQIEEMVAQRQANCEKSFVDHFRHTVPEHVSKYTDEELASLIRQGVEKASTYDVMGGPALLQFLSLTLIIAPNFHEEPAAHHFLRMPTLTADVKLQLLTNLICEQLYRSS